MGENETQHNSNGSGDEQLRLFVRSLWTHMVHKWGYDYARLRWAQVYQLRYGYPPFLRCECHTPEGKPRRSSGSGLSTYRRKST